MGWKAATMYRFPSRVKWKGIPHGRKVPSAPFKAVSLSGVTMQRGAKPSKCDKAAICGEQKRKEAGNPYRNLFFLDFDFNFSNSHSLYSVHKLQDKRPFQPAA